MKRRTFLGAAAVAGLASSQSSAVAASDKVSIGMVGVGGRGRGLLGTFSSLPDVNVSYLCDADQASLERASRVLGTCRPRCSANHERHAPGIRLEGRRRRGRGDSGSLACPRHDPCLRCRKGRVRRETGLSQHPRRAFDGRRGPPQLPHRAGGHAVPEPSVQPQGDRDRALRRPGRDPHGEGLERPVAR